VAVTETQRSDVIVMATEPGFKALPFNSALLVEEKSALETAKEIQCMELSVINLINELPIILNVP
jgi:hypothetical protein